ncbi:DUF6221 family protein [Streptomyces sp. NPDC058665]|uniref:DUF6221 family protein n=1 Tax=Streptomyces sp. NPDC058665 TaxID=3346586 RepID=UPI0036465E9C
MRENAKLVAFLMAGLDMEAQIAKGAGGDFWRCPSGLQGEVHDRTGAVVFSVRELGYDQHIARQNPARTLRRLERSRVLLDEYAKVADMDTDRPGNDFPSGHAVGLGFAVRQMAAEHADRLGYQAKWLPGFIP